MHRCTFAARCTAQGLALSIASTLSEAGPQSSALREMLQKRYHEIGKYVLACVDLSRSPGKVRPTKMLMDGTCFTPNASNCYIWLMSVGGGPRYDRFMLCEERAALQGLDTQVCARIGGKDYRKVRAMGNAMPLPCVGLVLACLLSECML